MVNENCLTCLFSEANEISLMLSDITKSEHSICNNINSPFYVEFVDENKTCRLYIDSIKYFKQKDRKEKLEELKRNK